MNIADSRTKNKGFSSEGKQGGVHERVSLKHKLVSKTSTFLTPARQKTKRQAKILRSLPLCFSFCKE